MNKLDKYTIENKNLSYLKFSNKSGSHINCLRVYKNNSKEHELRKIEVCLELLKRDKRFLTEAVFRNERRADIFNITDGIIYEICKGKQREKKDSFPEDLEIRSIDANKIFEEKDLD